MRVAHHRQERRPGATTSTAALHGPTQAEEAAGQTSNASPPSADDPTPSSHEPADQQERYAFGAVDFDDVRAAVDAEPPTPMTARIARKASVRLIARRPPLRWPRAISERPERGRRGPRVLRRPSTAGCLVATQGHDYGPRMAIMARPSTSLPVRTTDEAPTALRRCTFRRIATIARPRELPLYEVACTFPDRSRGVPLGDVESARPICDSCTYQGIFRADSD